MAADEQIYQLRHRLNRESLGPVGVVSNQAISSLMRAVQSITDWLRHSALDRPLITLLLSFEAGSRLHAWDANMRATSLIKVAVEAEMLRIRHMLTRQGMRAAYGLVAFVFVLGVLVLANIVGWQVLRLYVDSIYATVILLGINLLLTAIFAMLAAKSSPSYAEREALKVGQEALREVQGSVAISTVLLPLASRLIRSPRPRDPNRWLFGWRRKQPLLGAARGQNRGG